MKKFLKPVVIAAVLLAGASPLAVAAKVAAAAPAGATAGVNGIGVANIDAIVANSAAAKAAQAQQKSIYAAQFSAAQSREAALKAQLQPMYEKIGHDQDANVPKATLDQEIASFQQLQANGKKELEKIMEPVALSNAYVMEQINDKMSNAIQTAMTKNGVTLLLSPQAVAAASNAYNLNQAILAELDAALPSAQVQPPAGWMPREMREQQQAQAQAAQRGTAGTSDGR